MISLNLGNTPAKQVGGIGDNVFNDFVNSSSILSGIDDFLTRGLADDRQWAEQQARNQMEFQERMSNTSWQRAVEDMQKAGLNPALAYMKGGASSAQGAMAHTDSTRQHQQLESRKLFVDTAKFAVNQVTEMARYTMDMIMEPINQFRGILSR
jgi:hypothetical protein